MITQKPPHYLPEIPGELLSGISGNNYPLRYLSEIFGRLICNSFSARSNPWRDWVKEAQPEHKAKSCSTGTAMGLVFLKMR